jgi:hypothetical protein
MSESDNVVPPPRKRWPLYGLLIIVAVVGLFALSWVLTQGYNSRQTVERSFVIDLDFTKVRKIMVRTNAAKEIITMGGTSEFVDQKWSGGSLQAEGDSFGEALLKSVFSPDPGWQINLEGDLKVRTLDEYVGREVVTLRQNVTINPDFINSATKLVEGSPRLLDYEMTTRLEREENHTRVTLRLSQEIRTHAPWFAHRIANKRVAASAENALIRQQSAMTRLIDENKDQAWLFPLN